MAIKTVDIPNIPVHKQYPLPERMYWDRYHYSGMLYYDDSKVVDSKGKVDFSKFAIMFHGSGASGIPPIDNPEIKNFVEDGWVVLASRSFGVYKSTAQPTVNGYGYVNRPFYMGYVTKTARWVQSTLEYVYGVGEPFKDLAAGPIPPCIIIGQSMGSTATLAWSGFSNKSGFAPLNMSSKVKAAFVNGATLAATGRLSWNDPSRVISTMTYLFDNVKHLTWASYGYEDKLAPPAFVRRFMRNIDPDSPTFFISPGKYGHSWGSLLPKYEVNRANDLLLMPNYPFVEQKRRSYQASYIVPTTSDNTYLNFGGAYLDNNSATVFQPASLTKVVTVLTAFEKYDALMDQEVTILAEDIVGGSGNNVKAGDILSMPDLLRNILIPSSNNSAMALARVVGNHIDNGGVASFVKAMNVLAKRIGGSVNNFGNPHGLYHADNKITARSFAPLMHELSKNRILLEYAGTQTSVLNIRGAQPRQVTINHLVINLLKGQPSLLGAKTGTLDRMANMACFIKMPGGKNMIYVGLSSDGTANRELDYKMDWEDISLDHMRDPVKYGIK